ncbi:MAG: hypothetical protein PHV74_09940 [Dehalococcoidia bacterium]|nr:hypothetical protein [Dehalococcoidia bacterium]
MNKKELVLACLSPAKGAFHSPVQIQKLLFLIDRNIPEEIGGHHFNFQPYNYGPFDRTLYEVLEELKNEGLVEIVQAHTWHEYKLTDKGQGLSLKLIEGLPARAKDYIRQVSEFVRELTFTQLVSAIYKAYPEMRANSVFQG